MRNKIEERIKNKTYNKRKVLVVFLCAAFVLFCLIGRLVYLMIFDAEYYQNMAEELHEREREIKAARGEILDAKGKVLASNRTVCTISVIHSQIKEPEKVIALLSEKLKIDEAEVRKRVEKISSIEIVKTNVEKSTGDEIRECSLAGVKVDEDYKRYYPCGSLASKVIGFTGGDNQGIIGLEVNYRPSGGFTPDMINYACSTDVYKDWADMIAFDRLTKEDYPDKYYCVSAGCRKEKHYLHSYEEVIAAYKDDIMMTTELPEVLASAMGDRLYLARFSTKEAMDDFISYVFAAA